MSRGSIYRKLWQYWPPWDTGNWWKPSWMSAGDEFCNDSKLIIIPPFGAIVIFTRFREKMRNVMDDGYPCEKCSIDVYTIDLQDGDPSAWNWVDSCQECKRDWFLPRDKDAVMCKHITDVLGTSNPKLAYHVWYGGHRKQKCQCQKESWFNEEDIFAAMAAKKEGEGKQ